MKNVENSGVVLGIILLVVIGFFTLVPLFMHLFWNVMLIGWGGAALQPLSYWHCFWGAIFINVLTGGSRTVSSASR